MAANKEKATQVVQQLLPLIPRGYVFRPTDLDLLYYLTKKLDGDQVTLDSFHEDSLSAYHPQELIEKYEFGGEKTVYLFTSTERKYANGDRPCRSAKGGYWRASQKLIVIKDEAGEIVGSRRSLTFREGRQPCGTKTNWLMHEYKVPASYRPPQPENDSMLLDNWVLCKVYLRKDASVDPIAKGKSSGEDAAAVAAPSRALAVKRHADSTSQGGVRLGGTEQAEPGTPWCNQEASTHYMEEEICQQRLRKLISRDYVYAPTPLSMVEAPLVGNPGVAAEALQRNDYLHQLHVCLGTIEFCGTSTGLQHPPEPWSLADIVSSRTQRNCASQDAGRGEELMFPLLEVDLMETAAAPTMADGALCASSSQLPVGTTGACTLGMPVSTAAGSLVTVTADGEAAASARPDVLDDGLLSSALGGIAMDPPTSFQGVCRSNSLQPLPSFGGSGSPSGISMDPPMNFQGACGSDSLLPTSYFDGSEW